MNKLPRGRRSRSCVPAGVHGARSTIGRLVALALLAAFAACVAPVAPVSPAPPNPIPKPGEGVLVCHVHAHIFPLSSWSWASVPSDAKLSFGIRNSATRVEWSPIVRLATDESTMVVLGVPAGPYSLCNPAYEEGSAYRGSTASAGLDRYFEILPDVITCIGELDVTCWVGPPDRYSGSSTNGDIDALIDELSERYPNTPANELPEIVYRPLVQR